MRRSGLAAAIACGLLVVACSEQPTEPGERTPLAPPKPAFSAACSSPTTTCIQTLINALFPQGDLLRSANSFWANIQTKVNQGSKGRAQAQAKAAELVNFGLKNFQANKLIGGMGTTTQDNLISLNTNVLTYTGLTDAPSLPPEAFEEDGAAAVLTPQSPTTLVITGTEQAGVLVPAGAAPEVTVVSIRRLPDSPGPLLTSLDQFPLFYEFASSPEVTFTRLVTTGVCQSADFDPAGDVYSRLRLAHNVSPFEFGDIEILPRVDAPFLDCSNTGGEGSGPIGTLEYMGLTGLAYSGWNFMGRAVGRVARAVFLPDELHAAMLGTCCLGGSASKFSPFGAVDPASNPGGFSPVGPTTTTEEGGNTVTRTVLVTSQNGTPIASVPVIFSTDHGTLVTPQPVLTDQFGNATVSWTLPLDGGVYTLTAEVPVEDNAPTGPGLPAGNDAFTPDVAFEPTSLTFTATVPSNDLDVVLIGDFDVFNNTAADNADNQQFYKNFATFSGSGPRATQTQVIWYEGLGSLMPQHRSEFPSTYGNLEDLGSSLAAAGYTFSISSTTSLTNVPSNVKVLFIVVPTQTITFEEAAGLRSFVSQGGRLVVVSDNPGFYAAGESSNEALNTLLARMGADARDAAESDDCGFVTLPSTSLRSHQLTMNADGSTLSSLTIACATRLLVGEGDTPFMYNSANTEPLGAEVKLSAIAPPVDLIAELSRKGVGLLSQPHSITNATAENAAVGSHGVE